MPRNDSLFPEEPLQVEFPEKLSSTKRLILEMLAKAEWVSTSELVRVTNQKCVDRRIRELRDEMGYDTEASYINGEAHYRLRSDTRHPSKVRTYLSASEKEKFIASVEIRCALCSKEGEIGKVITFDHRIPHSRGGEGSIENFQLLCRECNNQKRSRCRGCQENCKGCFLAYPEKSNHGWLLRIVQQTLSNNEDFKNALKSFL